MKAEFGWTVVVVVLVLTATLSAISLNPPYSGEGSSDHAIFSKANHSPIRINGDSDFTSANGVVAGDGSVGNPYVISGWVIDASGAGAGIYVANTTKNFTIVNCEVYNANGGNYAIYHPNSGIVLNNVSATQVYIYNNTVHNNAAAGIHVYSFKYGTLHIGDLTSPENSNRIYNNTRGGIYISHSKVAYIENNMIYNNSVGLHFYYKTSDTTVVRKNGFGENRQEAIRVEHSPGAEIYDNIFYKNYGSGYAYNRSRIQATQTGDSTLVYWYNPSTDTGNFWLDWADNNETNYDWAHSDFVIPWGYPIVDVYNHNAVQNYDYRPLKGVHFSPLYLDGGDSPYKIYVPANGFVMYNWSENWYVMAGLEVNASSGEGYGILLYNLEKRVLIDSVIVHDVPMNTTNHAFRYNGNGIYLYSLEDTIVMNSHIYAYWNNGIVCLGNPASGGGTYDYVVNTWIHDPLYAIVANGIYVSSKTVISSSTIEDNTRGIYANFDSARMDVYNTILEHNGVGLYVDNSNDDMYVNVYYSSFFRNVHEGVRISPYSGTPGSGNSIWIYDNIFYENNGSTDHFNSSHIQIYAVGDGNHIAGNFYYDWVNNNRTNDMDGDGYVDWPYPIDGANLNDSYSSKHIYFYVYDLYSAAWHYSALVIDSSNSERLLYYGTSSGVVGYEDSTYYLVGWIPTSNYTLSDGAKVGVYLVPEQNMSLSLENIYVFGNHYGIVGSANNVSIWRTEITHPGIAGIYLGFTNVSIRECSVHNSEYEGIVLENPFGGEITNSTIYRNNDTGIWVESAENPLMIRDNVIYGNNNSGILLNNDMNVSVVSNGIAYNRGYGLYIEDSYANRIYGNVFYYNNNTDYSYNSSRMQAYEKNSLDYWNSTTGVGNLWYDWAHNNESNDADGDDVVDYPYVIPGSDSRDMYPMKYLPHGRIKLEGKWDMTWENGVVGGDGSVEYPYAIVGWNITSQVGFGIYMGNYSHSIIYIDGVKVSKTINPVSGPLYMRGEGISLYNITDDSWLTVLNSKLMDNEGEGITIWLSMYVNVYRSEITGNFDGVYIYYSQYVKLFEDNISGNRYEGVMGIYSNDLHMSYNLVAYNNIGAYFYSCVNSATEYSGGIHNNTFRLNQHYAIELHDSSGFLIYWNFFDRNNGSAGDGSYDSHHIQAYDNEASEYTNYWNTTSEGNCWSDWNQGTPYQIDPSPYIAKDHQPDCTFVPEFSHIVVAVLLSALLILLRRRR